MWRKLIGFENYYVSDKGSIIEVLDKKKNKYKVVQIVGNKWTDERRVELWKDGVPRLYTVPEIVIKAYYPDKVVSKIEHKNGILMDCRLENLVPQFKEPEEVLSIKGQKNKIKSVKKNNRDWNVTLINDSTGVVKKFQSCSAASKYLGLERGYISRNSKRNISGVGNWRWEIEKE